MPSCCHWVDLGTHSTAFAQVLGAHVSFAADPGLAALPSLRGWLQGRPLDVPPIISARQTTGWYDGSMMTNGKGDKPIKANDDFVVT